MVGIALLFAFQLIIAAYVLIDGDRIRNISARLTELERKQEGK